MTRDAPIGRVGGQTAVFALLEHSVGAFLLSSKVRVVMAEVRISFAENSIRSKVIDVLMSQKIALLIVLIAQAVWL